MKLKTISALAVSAVVLAGCQNMNYDTLAQSGGQLFQAATLTDADMVKLTDGACKEMDAKNNIAPAYGKYAARMDKIAKSLGSDVNGTKVNYKVYMTNEPNAWAMANGCVRVYSGLMDIMNDNEIEGVLGHELGPVKQCRLPMLRWRQKPRRVQRAVWRLN